MLFNSLEYIFLFLPLAVMVYFFLTHRGFSRTALVWLVVASFFFYGYWNPKYIYLIAISISINFALGWLLQGNQNRWLLILGLIFNLGLLGYYKYANFFADNINILLEKTNYFVDLPKIELPLAISFFTFLQIAYLVDCYQQKVKEARLLHYTLFVTYFPHLIAGPLVHHQELMPEFAREENKRANWANINLGLFIFSAGLFKKVFIADSFAEWANLGFNSESDLTFIDAWCTSLSYTMQLYFDFSGYSDMAIGASLIFNIKLPINFNSPYKALDIQDFWRRWHMTLSRWLREYLYIPLGGNRHGSLFTGINLFITFLLGGLWHGASWNFVIWGALHGLAIVTHRIWKSLGGNMPAVMGWFITFMFANIAWVFFRAETLGDSLRILSGMTNINSLDITGLFGTEVFVYLAIFLLVSFLSINTNEMAEKLKRSGPNILTCAATAILAGIPLYIMLFMASRISEFIYFNF